MVKICKTQLTIPHITGRELRRSLGRWSTHPLPDLVTRDETSAVECHLHPKDMLERLNRYTETYNHLTLVLAFPPGIDEIWLFNTKTKKIVKKVSWEE